MNYWKRYLFWVAVFSIATLAVAILGATQGGDGYHYRDYSNVNCPYYKAADKECP